MGLLGITKDVEELFLKKVKNGELMVFHGKKGRFVYHHISRCRGYVSRKRPEGQLENIDYKGRFGEGVTIKTPAYDSTRYCYRWYYIFKEAAHEENRKN